MVLYLLNNFLSIFGPSHLVEVSQVVRLLAFIQVHEVKATHVAKLVHDVPIVVFWDDYLV